MKRTVSVDALCSFTFEIDDEAVSEWDGAKILDVLEHRKDADPPLYTPDASMHSLLADLGRQLTIENRHIDHIDGWADFPREAADGHPYGVHWDIERVTVSPATGGEG